MVFTVVFGMGTGVSPKRINTGQRINYLIVFIKDILFESYLYTGFLRHRTAVENFLPLFIKNRITHKPLLYP